MGIQFKNLMLEVTRRCNMRCAHCMRGEQRQETMTSNVIQKLFSYVQEIARLTITGGEPSLTPESIIWIAHYAKTYGVKIGSFFCATNAGEYSAQFVDALNGLYAICDDPDRCALTVSTDQFHFKADEKALSEYRRLPYYSPAKENDFLPRDNILNEGRAAENDLGRFSKPKVEYIYDFDVRGLTLDIGDRIYINALGDVLLDPDLSYSRQAEESIGNVMDTPLDRILADSFYKPPSQYFPKDGKRCVYCVHLSSEAGAIAAEPIEDRRYYAAPHKAAVGYQNILNNLRITPVYPSDGKPFDDLDMRFESLPESGDRCEGTEIRYLFPKAAPKTVIVEVMRCPLEEDRDGFRE